ncbi:MAG: N,N-dimethylformamidase beta subunit family domain-containing protein [Limisphaerales bacterium]
MHAKKKNHPSSAHDLSGPTGLSRRELLKGVIGFGAAAALSGCATGLEGSRGTIARPPGRAQPDLVRRENEEPGTRDWLLRNPRVDLKTKYRCPWIEGYCSRTSVQARETLDIFVSTNPPSPFTIDFFRMGYYGGAGGRHVLRLGPFPGKTQPDPPIGKARVRECRWEPCASLTIPSDWVSGVYVGKLTAEREGWQSYVIFIVRDGRRADFIFQCSDTTWQAYNRWPSQFALYDDGKDQWYWGPDVDVSFDRPYGKYCQIFDAPLSTGSGEWFLWEFPLAYWLEAHGYDVTYISNLDTHASPGELARAKGFLSVGHDEYYSIEMFDKLRGAIAAGLNVAFFSGNTCCGRIDPRPGSSGAPHRVFSRTDFYGPRDEAEIKRFPAMARLPHLSPNANLLVGARSVSPITGGADWACTEPDHWIFEGTGMKRGDAIPGLVGWEWHGDPAPIPGLVVVSTGPTENGNTRGAYTATIYPGPHGNFVFNASSCWWGDGLSAPPGYVRPAVYTKPQGPDARAQRITANLLDRMRGGRA